MWLSSILIALYKFYLFTIKVKLVLYIASSFLKAELRLQQIAFDIVIRKCAEVNQVQFQQLKQNLRGQCCDLVADLCPDSYTVDPGP